MSHDLFIRHMFLLKRGYPQLYLCLQKNKSIMKRSSLFSLLLVAAVALFSNQSSSAQTFREGSDVISAGLGIGSALGGSYSYGSQTPGIALSYEHGNWEVGGPGSISLGAYLGFKSYKYSVEGPGYAYSQKWNYTIIGFRSAYHYNGFKDEKFDPYGGLMLSYDILSYKYSGTDFGNRGSLNYGGGVFLTAFFGGRYYFTDNPRFMENLVGELRF